MINETSVLSYLQRHLGSKFILEDANFYIDIIKNESLPVFSEYYPRYIPGIAIKESDGIKAYNPTTRKYAIAKYQIPMYSNDDIIDIAGFYHPWNNKSGNYYGFGYNNVSGSLVSVVASANVLSALPHTNTLIKPIFEPPDKIALTPILDRHVDFTIDIKVVRQLHQIMPSYRSMFFKLCLLDVKICLYNKHFMASKATTYGGLEIDSGLDSFESAISDRDSLLEEMAEDSPKYRENIAYQLNFMSY